MDPQKNQNPMPQGTTEKKSFGPLIGIVVIIAVIVIGGLYFWGGMFSGNGQESPAPVAPATSSADIDSIQADLNSSVGATSTDFSDIENTLNQ